MEITREQYEQIAHLFPKHRGNVRYSNLEVLNAILYVTENGCKWRGLPPGQGKWNSFYQRWYRWNKQGVIQRVFQQLGVEGKIPAGARVVALDSTSIKVHPDGTGALKNTGHRPWANPTAVATPRSM